MKTQSTIQRWLRPVIALTVVLGFVQSVSGDTLYLRDGEQQAGRLVKMSKNKVWFEGREGVRVFKKDALQKVELQQERQWDAIESADQITDPDLRSSVDKQPTEQDHPSAGAVYMLERQTYDLTEPGVVKDTTRSIVKVLRQRGEDEASQAALYFEDTDVPSVDFALTVTPDGRVLHLSDAALKNESLFAELPQYRRLARYRFACKEPRPGSILDTQYTVLRKRGDPLEPFYAEELFRDEQPLLRKEVVVILPAAREKELAIHIEDHGLLSAAREVEGDRVRLVWSLNAPQRGIIPEPFMPPVSTFVPRLTLTWATDWDTLAATYAKALAALPPLSDELKAKAIELAGPAKGAEGIYLFVARNIRTLPVPHSCYRFVPHAPQETDERGMGNELDKNMLYFAMLRAAGIPAQFALLRSRERGPLDMDAPSLRALDRSAVLLGEPGRFSTAFSDLLPFNTLPSDLHAASAFVVLETNALLTEAQAPPPAEEQDVTRFDGAIDPDGTLRIEVTYSGAGNGTAWMREMKDLDQQQIENQLRQWASALHPSAQLDKFSVSDLADLTKPPAVTLRCTIPGYATTAGNDLMLFTLPALFYSARDVGRPDREHALHWPHVSQEIAGGALRLPDGFQAYALPKPATVDSNVASYEARVAATGNILTFADAFELKVQDAPREAYADYKECVETRAKVPRQRIVLTRQQLARR